MHACLKSVQVDGRLHASLMKAEVVKVERESERRERGSVDGSGRIGASVS